MPDTINWSSDMVFTAWESAFEESDVVKKGAEFNTPITSHFGISVLSGKRVFSAAERTLYSKP